MKKLKITVGKKSYEVTVEVLSDDTPQRRNYGAADASSSGPPPGKSAPSAPAVSKPTGAKPVSQVAGEKSVLSPMAGLVRSVAVQVGDEVEKGQKLVVLEAMKMENQISAPTAGTVKAVHVSEGEQIPDGHVLVELE